MMPGTLVRSTIQRPRGPFTFIGLSSFFLEREEGEQTPKTKHQRRRARVHRCVAVQADGSACGLTARCVSMKLGGFVCDEHRTDLKQEVLAV